MVVCAHDSTTRDTETGDSYCLLANLAYSAFQASERLGLKKKKKKSDWCLRKPKHVSPQKYVSCMLARHTNLRQDTENITHTEHC